MNYKVIREADFILLVNEKKTTDNCIFDKKAVVYITKESNLHIILDSEILFACDMRNCVYINKSKKK